MPQTKTQETLIITDFNFVFEDEKRGPHIRIFAKRPDVPIPDFFTSHVCIHLAIPFPLSDVLPILYGAIAKRPLTVDSSVLPDQKYAYKGPKTTSRKNYRGYPSIPENPKETLTFTDLLPKESKPQADSSTHVGG